ncbi:guanine nucleotide-binding protein G(s) subunit alpha isoforms XLas-like [Dermacentor albipictus]|uniref:guanine nucleotide-binding protein G(s) subunit alpha isoforms XLas-like n=1 Tax=Dermacentor albipictus TaxID=60249 RepID=UPI0038FC574A
MPRCVAALAPVLTLPALQIMSPDDTAACFFQMNSLEVVAFLALVTAGHSSSGSLLQRFSYLLCSKYGLQVRALYFSLTCMTYVLAIFMPKSLVAVLFVLTVDKVLSCVHESELDRTLIEERVSQEPKAKVAPYRRSQSLVPSVSDKPDTDKLFARLAQAVDVLNDETAETVTLNKRKNRMGPDVQTEKEQHQKQEKWEVDPSGWQSPLNAIDSPLKSLIKRLSKSIETSRKASLVTLSRRTSLPYASTASKADDDTATNTGMRKRFSDKLRRRSGVPTSSGMANTESSGISSLAGLSQRDQATALDASAPDVIRRQLRTPLLDSLPGRNVSARRQRAQKRRRSTDAESVTTKTSAEAPVMASAVPPDSSAANKNCSKVPTGSTVERVDDSQVVAVHSGSKGPEKGGAPASTAQSIKSRKRRDKSTKEPAGTAPTAAGSSAKDPQPAAAASRDGTTPKRKSSTGSHRRKKRSQEGAALAVTNSDAGAPRSAFPGTAEGAATAVAPPEAGGEPPNESPPAAATGVDVGRPSIMKLPSSAAAAQAPANVRRRQSTVDFGLPSPKDLNECDMGRSSASPDGLALSGEKLRSSKGACQFAAGVAGVTPSELAGGFSKQLSPTGPNAWKHRVSRAPRRSSVFSHVSSPVGRFASASANDSTSPISDLAKRRTKQVYNSTTHILTAHFNGIDGLLADTLK